MSLWGPPIFRATQNRARKHGFEMEDRYVDLASVCTLPSGLTKYKSERLSSHLTPRYSWFSAQPYSVIHDTITYMWHFNFFPKLYSPPVFNLQENILIDSSQTSFGKVFSLKNVSPKHIHLVLFLSAISEGCMAVQTQKARKSPWNQHASLIPAGCFMFHKSKNDLSSFQ